MKEDEVKVFWQEGTHQTRYGAWGVLNPTTGMVKAGSSGGNSVFLYEKNGKHYQGGDPRRDPAVHEMYHVILRSHGIRGEDHHDHMKANGMLFGR